MDTFDPKPALARYAGQPIDDKVKGDVIVRQGSPGPLMPSPFSFKKYGQSGIEVSEIFPHLSQHVDEIAFLRSVYGRSNDHVQGTYEMQTGQINLGFPSVGSWVTYGLGSVVVEPAGLRGDDRCPRRTARRPQRLERRLHAGRVPGHALPIDRRPDRRPEAAGQRHAGRPAGPARRPGPAERARPAEVPRQQRAGGAHLLLRAGLPDAGLRARRGRRRQRVGRDQGAVRPRRQGDRAVRPAVPDGAAAGRARRALRAGVLRRGRQPERGYLGRARRRARQPHPARRRDRQADGRPAHRPARPRPARLDGGDHGTPSSGGCRSRSAASAAITTRARRRC